MEIFLVVLLVAAVAGAAALVLRDRGRGAGGLRRAGGRGRPHGGFARRRGRAQADPLAAAIADHSRALDPQDVAEQEARLRAQANRVAAAEHERHARTGGEAADGTGHLEADAHRRAAAQHERMAASLDGGAVHGGPQPAYDPSLDGLAADPGDDPYRRPPA